MKKIDVTLVLFFEIKDSEVYGGEGEKGYAESKVDLVAEDLLSANIEKYAQDQICGVAKLCNVLPEKIRTISREEYEQNTEEEGEKCLVIMKL